MGRVSSAALAALLCKRRAGLLGTWRRRLCVSHAVRTHDRQILNTQLFSQRRRINRLRKQVLGLPRKWWVRPIFEDHEIHGAWFTSIPTMRERDPDRFYNFFRMTPQAFDKLLGLVGPHIQKRSWRKSICPGERLAITLRFLASGDSFETLSYLFLVSGEAIGAIVLETCTIIWTVLQPLVFEEFSEEFWLKKAAEFEVMWDLPHCLAAIDGKHVHIKAPPHSGSRFRNYKQFFSLILMAVCDAKQKFVYVDVGASGRRGDGNVYHKCAFGKGLKKGKLHIPPPCHLEGMQKNLPFFVAGDGAFERQQFLVNPFKGKLLKAPERLFNYRFSRARRSVEDGFGILYKRFGIFKGPIEASKTTAHYATLACCALHNFHLNDDSSIPPKRHIQSGRWKMEDPEKELQVYARLTDEVARAKEEGGDNDMLFCEEIREELLEYFIEHAIPWQWKKAHVFASRPQTDEEEG